jgi:hypothetical protein
MKILLVKLLNLFKLFFLIIIIRENSLTSLIKNRARILYINYYYFITEIFGFIIIRYLLYYIYSY